jgi:hypothetical protein
LITVRIAFGYKASDVLERRKEEEKGELRVMDAERFNEPT